MVADGTPVEVGGRNQRVPLLTLLLRANKLVTTDFLVYALWGEQPPLRATASLQNAIATLRKLLGADLIVTRPGGYRLAVDADSIDLHRFERLVSEARTLAPEESAARLREALALWRGEPLPEFQFESFAEQEIARLEELYLGTLEARIDADIAGGRYSEVVPELQALVAQQPVRERLRAQLMRALAYSGRRADAGRAYQDARSALVEHGFEPSPELRELQRQILNDELPRPRRVVAAAGTSHFEEVAAALAARRLVPVLGDDVGALAEQLARRFEYAGDGHGLARVAQFVALTKEIGRAHV